MLFSPQKHILIRNAYVCFMIGTLSLYASEPNSRQEEATAVGQHKLTVSHSISAPIPAIAYKHEDVYRRFINGKLIYRPNPSSDVGLIEFPLSQFAHTLAGEFNLSGLEFTYDNKQYNVADYLRIKVGCSDLQEDEQDGEKPTVWIAPRFVVPSNNLFNRNTPWLSPMGVFWTRGDFVSGEGDFDHLTIMQFDEISDKNLHDLWLNTWVTSQFDDHTERVFSLFLMKF